MTEMMSEIITKLFEYASTYDKILAVVGSILILSGLFGGIDGIVRVNLSISRQIIMVLLGFVIVMMPVLPLIFRDITLQELKSVKKKIDDSKTELGRLYDKNGGDHGYFLANNLNDGQKIIDALIAKKEGK